MKPNWKGPYEGGLTQSLINKFLECPYRFYLYTILGLKEDEGFNENLIWGDTFHKGLEHLIAIPYPSQEFTPQDWAGIDDAVDEHIKSKYAAAPSTFRFSVKNMLRLYDDSYKEENTPFKTEVVFAHEYTTARGFKVLLRGKCDGLAPPKALSFLPDPVSSPTLIEHKCKGKLDLSNKAEILYDLQVNLYCLCTGARNVIYDIIRIPDTQFYLPRRRQMEGAVPYMNRLYYTEISGDFPIRSKKPLWLAQFHETIMEDDLQSFRAQTIDPLIERICLWWEHVIQPGFDPDHPSCHNSLFYRTPIRHFDPGKTERFKCSYWNYLTGGISREDLIPVENYYAELQSEV